MIAITVKLPHDNLRAIDDLVVQGKYASRSEAIREAVRDFLKKNQST